MSDFPTLRSSDFPTLLVSDFPTPVEGSGVVSSAGSMPRHCQDFRTTSFLNVHRQITNLPRSDDELHHQVSGVRLSPVSTKRLARIVFLDLNNWWSR